VRIPEAQIAQIVDRLDIVDVVAEYSALRQRGGRYWGLCPFHTEKTPSFTVSADKSAFYCFGCGKGGGLIQFVMDVEQLPFPEAVRLLAERAGVQLEAERRPDGSITRREYVELNSRIAETFHHVLRTSTEAAAARAYLEQRGIEPQAVAAFKLGWAPAAHGWLLQFLRRKQFSDRFLAQSGLFARRGGDAGGGGGTPELRALFWGRLMFPIINARGEVLAFGGRTLAPEGAPKYVNSAETPFFRKHEQLFGLNHALPLLRAGGQTRGSMAGAGSHGDIPAAAGTHGPQPRVVVVEGYTDVIALTGLRVPAVAALGTAFGPDHARLLKRYQLAAAVMFDADEAGHTAALRSLRELARHEVPAAVVPLPAGRDPADLVAAGEVSELQRMLESPITASRYTIQAACAGKDLSTAEGKEQAFRDLYPYLREVESVIAREALLQEVAVHLRLEYDTVGAEFRRLAAGSRAASRRPAAAGPASATVPGADLEPAAAELRLMLAVTVNRELYAVVRSRLEVDELEDARARVLYIALEDCYRHDQTDTESLLQRLESAELRSLVARTLTTDEFSVNSDAYVNEGIRRVKSHALERKRDLLLEQVRQAEHAGASRVVTELLADKIYLDSELNKLRGEAVSR
jgi:DNA primase